jgi:hypothetical protein
VSSHDTRQFLPFLLTLKKIRKLESQIERDIAERKCNLYIAENFAKYVSELQEHYSKEQSVTPVSTTTQPKITPPTTTTAASNSNVNNIRHGGGIVRGSNYYPQQQSSSNFTRNPPYQHPGPFSSHYTPNYRGGNYNTIDRRSYSPPRRRRSLSPVNRNENDSKIIVNRGRTSTTTIYNGSSRLANRSQSPPPVNGIFITTH